MQKSLFRTRGETVLPTSIFTNITFNFEFYIVFQWNKDQPLTNFSELNSFSFNLGHSYSDYQYSFL